MTKSQIRWSSCHNLRRSKDNNNNNSNKASGRFSQSSRNWWQHWQHEAKSWLLPMETFAGEEEIRGRWGGRFAGSKGKPDLPSTARLVFSEGECERGGWCIQMVRSGLVPRARSDRSWFWEASRSPAGKIRRAASTQCGEVKEDSCREFEWTFGRRKKTPNAPPPLFWKTMLFFSSGNSLSFLRNLWPNYSF